ncbi:MAG TPA: hypothetical protein VJX70_12620 [Candidatus Acidoferrum sp.]|nr:hypothetical protein [Candidatus Acidoferrum sp.]
MKKLSLPSNPLTLLAAAILAGCSSTSASPDVASGIRTSLDRADLKGVSVSQDQSKGIVTLGGQVGSENDEFRSLSE